MTTGGTESQVAYTSPSEWLRGCEVHIHEPASDIELCSINDEIGHHLYQDYFYKSGGKWWLHKETGKQIPNMNDVDVSTSYANIEYATIPKPTDYVAYGSYTSAKIFCTHAQWAYLVPSGWNSASNVNKIYSNAVTTYNWLGFPKNTGRTAIIAKLAGCIIYYPLATPTNTEVANEELITNLDNLWSTYGCEKYTIISTEADDTGNAEPVLEVTQGDITGKGTEFTLEGTERIPMTYKIFGQAIQDGTPSTSTPVPIETVKGNNSVTFTGPSGQIDYSIVGKMTLADQRIIDNCGTAEQVQVVFRESKQI